MANVILLQIQDQINKATRQLSAQREEYKETERCILSAGKTSHGGLEELLSKFKKQKEELQATRQHIAVLSETGIAVNRLK